MPAYVVEAVKVVLVYFLRSARLRVVVIMRVLTRVIMRLWLYVCLLRAVCCQLCGIVDWAIAPSLRLSTRALCAMVLGL